MGHWQPCSLECRSEFTCCAGSKLNAQQASSAAFCLIAERVLRLVLRLCFATAIACVLRQSHCAWRRRQKLKLIGDGSSNGVDVDRFSPGPSDVRDNLGIPVNAFVLGFVGRLTCDKGLPELMESFDTILEAEPETHLLLVGWFDAAEDALSAEPSRFGSKAIRACTAPGLYSIPCPITAPWI